MDPASGTAAVRRLISDEDETALRSVVEAARNNSLQDEDLAELAQGLAHSGARLRPDLCGADLASTGGPSSLSTLVCPLYIRARGLSVAKLGVPGRPAGGVDVLQQVPGFDARLDLRAAEQALRRYGCIHLLADERWAPLDARLFAYRQRTSAQTLPPLVIASILSKKLAAGAVGAGLEIRIADHGNFGADASAATRNAYRFRAVAQLLDLRPVALLTDASEPYQPYIGRGEALLALAEILSGDASGWLAEHQNLCSEMADAVATAMGRPVTDHIDAREICRWNEALLTAHGTSMAAFNTRVAEVRAAPRTVFRAERPGVVRYDLGRIRSLLVERQRAEPRQPSDPPADPAGVILLARPGQQIDRGDPVISVRVPRTEATMANNLAGCASVQRGAKDRPGLPSSLKII